MNIPLIILIILASYLIWKYWALALGAGYDPTPVDSVRKMLELAKPGPDDVLYDLGCGDARIILTAASRYGCRAVGIEADPLRWFFCWLRVRQSGLANLVSVKLANFFSIPLNEATIVTIFLFKTANERLKPKFNTELPTGAAVVSYIWKLDGWKPEIVLTDEEIYLYRIPGAPG